MPSALPRAGLHDARLLQCLVALGAEAPAHAAPPPLAEQLGGWLDWTQAGEVANALELDLPAIAAATPLALQRARWALAGARQLPGQLAEALQPPRAPGRRSELRSIPRPHAGASLADMADFTPYRQHILGLQGQWQDRIEEMRTQLRGVLARLGPDPAQLAALDVAWAAVLSPRLHQSTAAVPHWLGERYEQLRRAHASGLAAEAEDGPAAWLAPGGWLARFTAEMNDVLQAELSLRLQPLEGLAEALNQVIESHR